MPRRSTILVLLAGLAYCLALGAVVSFLAQDFPNYGILILLAGILVPGLLLGVTAGRVLVGKNRRVEYAARLQKSRRSSSVACATTVLGLVLMNFKGIAEIIGMVVTVGSICVWSWILLRAIPSRHRCGEDHLGEGI